MTTLKVGIASYAEMKPPNLGSGTRQAGCCGRRTQGLVHFDELFAKVLSAGNRALLQVIAEQAPGSLDELAQMTGKAKSNLSRTLKKMEGYGLVHLERGARGRIAPKVIHDRVELDLPIASSLRTSVSRDAARRLARLGGSGPDLRASPRRRAGQK